MVMWSMGITNAYTLEASSAGSSLRARAGTHYRAHDYELIGQRFCETLLDYVDTSPIKVGEVEERNGGGGGNGRGVKGRRECRCNFVSFFSSVYFIASS